MSDRANILQPPIFAHVAVLFEAKEVLKDDRSIPLESIGATFLGSVNILIGGLFSPSQGYMSRCAHGDDSPDVLAEARAVDHRSELGVSVFPSLVLRFSILDAGLNRLVDW